MKTVSIIMATFNGARFIGEQLSSLAAQTYPSLELIISDDGSNDGTLAIIDEFCRNAPFPVIVRRNETRLGYAENFLSASKLATGDYIAFCDQDDRWTSEKIEVAVEALSSSGAELFVHSASLMDVSGSTIGQFSQGINKSHVYEPLELGPWAVFYGCTMVFSRKLLDLVDGAYRGPHTFEFEGLLSHDLWIYFLATSLGKVIVDERPLICYRQHHANQTPHVQTRRFRAWWISLGIAAHPKLKRSEIADHRCGLMEHLCMSASDPGVKYAATRAARYWRQLAIYELERVKFYSARGLFHRALGCGILAWRGGYKSVGRGGLGWQLLIKDLLVGVFRLVAVFRAYRSSR
ncbi:glycosyltransferase family 2 protein [Bradyrhizobium sp. sBnM-33]|uniref:glycosyltransferase family 2 protein n=1 Tax=Bradyrhizobium sp. sBnM-33 TaxID=2831780 RepID=UPI001BCD7FEF|nr:glycosyltransferase family 2 protein [Bradyrhizobium sp. sBnM-33]WOH53662.1 glycosyltransferase family 2 protein [Bradyrhizobium sp. sBnM-33]